MWINKIGLRNPGILYGLKHYNPKTDIISIAIMEKEQIQKFKNQLIADGFLLLLSRANSVEIQDHLNSYLDPAIHFDIAQKSA
mgnify:CR=1 FL=1